MTAKLAPSALPDAVFISCCQSIFITLSYLSENLDFSPVMGLQSFVGISYNELHRKEELLLLQLPL